MLVLIMEKLLVYFPKEFELEQFYCFEASPINFNFLKKNIENRQFKK